MAKEENITVNIRFFEGDSQTPFAVSDVPIEQLPDTFEIDTVMHLGEDDWRVLKAEPAEKTHFRESKNLNLFLAKDELSTIDPNEVLFSLATINNSLAQVKNADSLEDVMVFREDDWRQVEFVDVDNEDAINQEFGCIYDIYQNHLEEAGFKEIHLRDKIEEPLKKCSITIDMLKESFDVVKCYNGVAFNTAAATIVNGFALEIKYNWVLWGEVNEEGNILTLNISQLENADVKKIAKTIDDFLQSYNLFLVDWTRLFWCGKEKASFLAYEGN